jgi:hypothetical protein
MQSEFDFEHKVSILSTEIIKAFVTLLFVRLRE